MSRRKPMTDTIVHSCMVNRIPLSIITAWRFPVPVHVIGYDELTEQWICQNEDGKVCRALAFQLEHEAIADAVSKQL